MAEPRPGPPTLAVVGFTVVDHPMAVSALAGPNEGAIVTERLATPWPRVGGSGANIATAAASCSQPTELVSWVGHDEVGGQARDALDRARVGTRGVAVCGGRTGSAWMFYDPSGRSVSFLDPGHTAPNKLSAIQRDALAAADWVCVAAAPSHLTTAALDNVSERTRVAWVVKADHTCFPWPLVIALLRRATVVVLNAAEWAFLGDDVVSTELLIVTDGTASIQYRAYGRWRTEPVSAVECPDPTGAGDTFSGVLLAHLMAGHHDPGQAVAAAAAATRTLLVSRAVRVPPSLWDGDEFGAQATAEPS